MNSGRLVLGVLVGLALAGCASLFERDADRTRAAAERAEAARRAELESMREAGAMYSAIVYFELGSATLDDAGRHELAWFVEQMRPYPTARLDVQGFTDSTGGDAANTKIARERASAVAAALEALGVAKDRLVVEALGERAPAATNKTSQGRRNNRRVEVTVRMEDPAAMGNVSEQSEIVPANP
jgi:outer membrane protein OmpA-like peptidoglycan-associated protein